MPDEGSLAFVLQVLAIFLGGGTVQLIIRVISRRSDLRKVNSESDSVVVAAANNQVVRLEGELERQARELSAVRKDLGQERHSRDAQIAEIRVRHAQALIDSQQLANDIIDEFRKENVKLNRVVVKLQLDLSRAAAEISSLKMSHPD